jgi:transcriptional regulator
MHPNPAFRNDAAALDRVAAIGFAHIAVFTPAGPMMVHAPVTRHAAGLRFHVARHNRATPYLDGAMALLSVSPVDGYISPNWYAAPTDQVPTWNYVAIEVEGRLRLLDEPALIEQLDDLAARHEPRVNPAAPWTRDKMDAARFQAMLQGIRGFELLPTAIRGTTKLSQNKSSQDRQRVVAALDASGNGRLATAMADALAPAVPAAG